MVRPYALLPPPRNDAPSLRVRAEAFLRRTIAGRVLLGALALFVLSSVLPLPRALGAIAKVTLCIYALWGAFRLARYVLDRVLWRIRTKLIVSYLFIALVPVLLLTLLFFIAAVLGGILVAAHLVNEELAQLGRSLNAAADVALTGLPADDRAAAAAFEARLSALRRQHPRLAATFLRGGRVVAHWGEVPRALPAWWKGTDFAGLASEADGPEVFRAVSVRGDRAVILDLPIDQALFKPLEERSGIHVLGRSEMPEDAPPRGRRRLRVDVEDEGGRDVRVNLDEGRGLIGMALPEHLDWATGERESRPLPFRFRPLELVRRLSPGLVGRDVPQGQSVADILVIAFWAVGSVFLTMYGVALVLGFLLARSITRSIHGLSLGTDRLRRGDFSSRIPVTSRDQLGELADSFNHMAGGIEDLLRMRAVKDRLEEELRIARQIQMSLLPAEVAPTVAGLRVAALCLPAAEVGGDYYDLLPLSDTRLGVLVADVSGKGTSAALYMAELKGLVLSLSRIYDSPARLLSEANRILAANMDARSFITMTYAVLDVGTRTMRFARAGHNPAIHLEAGTGKTRILTPPGLGLGLDRGDRFDQILREQEIALCGGDVFLFFTDGLSEAMNGAAELFGEGRLSSILADSASASPEEIRERILEEVRAFAGDAAQADDMTMVILRVV
jgi:sigma-B regulation protein RsbU (phosphoserine phosphatase)